MGDVVKRYIGFALIGASLSEPHTYFTYKNEKEFKN